MLTRFKTNVTRYPRLFTAWMVLIVLAVVENVILPRLVGIEHALLADAIIALVLAVVVYLWVVRSGSRTSILLNVLDALEGREAYCSTCDFEETTEEDYNEESEAEEADEEVQ